MTVKTVKTWYANKDGRKYIIHVPDGHLEEIKAVYRDMGYGISMTEDWWEVGDA